MEKIIWLSESQSGNQNEVCQEAHGIAFGQSLQTPTKQVHWTLKDWLLVEINYLHSPDGNIFLGKSDRYKCWGEDLISRWREAGRPDLGEIPRRQTGTEVNLVDYCLGAIAGALAQNVPDK